MIKRYAGSCVLCVLPVIIFAIIRGNGLKLPEMMHMFEEMVVQRCVYRTP